MVKINGNKNIVVSNDNCSDITINGKNNFVSTTSSSPRRLCGYLSKVKIPSFRWKGKVYTSDAYFNYGYVRKGLDEIYHAWQTHCFGYFLESLEKFDDLMRLFTDEANENMSLVAESTDEAKHITVFTAKLFENFEGRFTYINNGWKCLEPFFIDYIVDNGTFKDSYIVGYKTRPLEDESLFTHGIYNDNSGDLHELYLYMQDWYDHLHNSLVEVSNGDPYQAIPLCKFIGHCNNISEILKEFKFKTHRDKKKLSKLIHNDTYDIV